MLGKTGGGPLQLRAVGLLISAFPDRHLILEENNSKLFSLSVGPESVLCCGWKGEEVNMRPGTNWRPRGCCSGLGKESMKWSPERKRNLFLCTGFHTGRHAKGM